MNFYLFAFLSFSILIAAGIGIGKFKKIPATYHPFIAFCIMASVNELYSFIAGAQYRISTNPNNNIYVLIEGIIICWQLMRWQVFGKTKALYWLIQCSLVLVWLVDWYREESLWKLFHYYRFYYSAVLVLLSLVVFNSIVFGEIRSLKKNSIFLISLAYIIIYSCKIMTELFWLYGLDRSLTFQLNVYAWFVYINLFINLLFIVAVLWIPKKPPYISYTS